MPTADDDACAPLVEAIQRWARVRPQETAVIVLGDGENETDRISFGELDRRARRIAAHLFAQGLAGRPLLLPAHSNRAFIETFCGCLYAGVIAVPAPVQARNRGWERIRAIAEDAQVAAIVRAPGSLAAESAMLPGVRSLDLTGPDFETTESTEPSYTPASTAEQPALLQYTSGSTGAPKGVVITHRNLAANLAMIKSAMEVSSASRFLTWLPLFHDMGIANVLCALASGIVCIVMPPLTFLQKPLRWLRVISRHRATISGAPNFAFELCARRAAGTALDGLDLGSWDIAFCAAEPVRLSTLRRFAQTFAPLGFQARALYPCYGAAEATVFVSGGRLGDSLEAPPAAAHCGGQVSCGRPAAGGTIAIVDPVTRAIVPEGTAGEIWVCGDHVAAGYWNNPTASAETFGAGIAPAARGAFLRTGDLGLRRNGDLYVVGRLKDTIIHHGVNIHPEDVEATVAGSHRAFGPTAAAFSIDVAEQEQVIVVQEVARERLADLDPIETVDRALDAVASAHGLRLYDLKLVRPGTIPRTTSGKIQRHLCRERYLAGELALVPCGRGHPLLAAGPVQRTESDTSSPES
jgi:acyl-CoA synthetase (AMP-forming)/AMP-acid ligase II